MNNIYVGTFYVIKYGPLDLCGFQACSKNNSDDAGTRIGFKHLSESATYPMNSVERKVPFQTQELFSSFTRSRPLISHPLKTVS